MCVTTDKRVPPIRVRTLQADKLKGMLVVVSMDAWDRYFLIDSSPLCVYISIHTYIYIRSGVYWRSYCSLYSYSRWPQGHIVRVLGAIGDKQAETEAVLVQV